MLTSAQLIKFVENLNPQNTPARLSFYNFLKSHISASDMLSVELIELFFNYGMDYPHWASNKSQLGHEVQFLLENFNSHYHSKLDLNAIRFPQNMQIIELENYNDAVQAITCYVKTFMEDGDKFRIIPDQNKRVIAVILRKDKSLEVRCFDRKFSIRHGIIEPLRKDLCLYYTSQLELSPNHLQKIEISPYITAQMHVRDGKTYGNVLRGYVFQKLMELNGERLNEQPRLFFPVKRLEQFFIDRKSDPYYQQLVSQLERCRALVEQGDREAANWGRRIIAQSETALENIFVGDKFLQLLIRDLAHNIERAGLSGPKMNSDLVPSSIKSDRIEEECLKIAPIKEYDSTNL